MDANIITTVATGLGILGGVYAIVNRSEDRTNRNMDARFRAQDERFGERFNAINTRFDDMRDLWRAELRRVEEVLDARLKHLEEREK
jgi:hypothetical protein